MYFLYPFLCTMHRCWGRKAREYNFDIHEGMLIQLVASFLYSAVESSHMPSWREAKVFSSPTSLSNLEKLLSLFKNIHFALNEISWNITRGHKSLEIFFFSLLMLKFVPFYLQTNYTVLYIFMSLQQMQKV